MDTYADDLAALIDTLDLKDATLIGFSTGGGEVARYIGRHGTARVAQAVLVSAVPPLMLQTDDNPGGVPVEVFDGLRAGSLADRSQLYRDLADGPFFGYNRPGAKVSQGVLDAFWRQGMQAGHKNAYECIAAFSATDFTEDLEKFDVPTLVIHGDDDQVVPLAVGGKASAELIAGATLTVYPGAPHGITDTHKEQLGRRPARVRGGVACPPCPSAPISTRSRSPRSRPGTASRAARSASRPATAGSTCASASPAARSAAATHRRTSTPAATHARTTTR